MNSDQTQKSVESFDWQWTERTVFDSTRTFHRRLFKDCGIWLDYLDGKVVADVCSGNGEHFHAPSDCPYRKKKGSNDAKSSKNTKPSETKAQANLAEKSSVQIEEVTETSSGNGMP